jgi:hypothetical protein
MNFHPNNRKQLLILAAIAVVGIFLLDQVVFRPLRDAWKSRSTRLTELKVKVNDGELLIKRAESLQSRWSQIRTHSLPVDTAAAESLILGAFDRWSKSSRVSVSSIRPQWKRADNDHMTLECRADVGGSLGEITRFLYEIESDPIGVKVDRATLATRDSDGAQISLDLQVSGLQLIQNNQSKR